MRHMLQKQWILDIFGSTVAAESLLQLVILEILLILSASNHAPTDGFFVDVPTKLVNEEHDRCIDHVSAWLNLDHLLYDISPIETTCAGPPSRPHQALTLDSWDDNQSDTPAF